jgi:hypothetical protein
VWLNNPLSQILRGLPRGIDSGFLGCRFRLGRLHSVRVLDKLALASLQR